MVIVASSTTFSIKLGGLGSLNAPRCRAAAYACIGPSVLVICERLLWLVCVYAYFFTKTSLKFWRTNYLRFPLTKAKKQFAVHQEVAAQLEGLHLLCDKPRYRQESRQYQAGDTDTDRTESTSGENGADAKFVVGERVLFDFNNRWVSVRMT